MKEKEERGGSHLDQEQGEEMFSFFFFPISERLETCLNIGRREAVERIN